MISIIDLVYALLIAAAIFASFVFGLKTSDKYHEQKEYEVRQALQKQFVRLKANVDTDDPVQPYVAPEPKYAASREFMRRLKTNGSATEAVR